MVVRQWSDAEMLKLLALRARGHSWREIAAIMDRPLGSVKAVHFRIMEDLRISEGAG